MVHPKMPVVPTLRNTGSGQDEWQCQEGGLGASASTDLQATPIPVSDSSALATRTQLQAKSPSHTLLRPKVL